MKTTIKAFFILLLFSVSILSGCSNSNIDTVTAEPTTVVETTTEPETLCKNDLHNKLDEVYILICTAFESSNELASRIAVGWDDHNNFTKDIFNQRKYEERKHNLNDAYKQEVEKVYELRTVVADETVLARNSLKEYNDYSDDSYYKALKEMYLLTESLAEFAIGYPDGYSLLTYSQKILEVRDEFSKLQNNAEFER